ncbi:MAG: hypothetical protein RRC34_11200 [Lentisphaeria bacterium]|nr:hypothetical protein [Lentisphaeria bacterium]
MPVRAADDVEPKDWPAADFLAAARQPFLTRAWGRFSGTVQYKSGKETVKADLTLAVLMRADVLRAQFVLNNVDVYDVIQAYAEDGMSNVRVTMPETVTTTPIHELGVAVEDITFSFLYWDFVEELDSQRVRGQRCRVLKLRNPQTLATAVVSFAEKYVGPLRVEFFNADGDQTRKLEFTDFEREGELYYVKGAQLRGDGWKTQVKFKTAELAESAKKAPPADLFLPQAQEKPADPAPAPKPVDSGPVPQEKPADQP